MDIKQCIKKIKKRELVLWLFLILSTISFYYADANTIIRQGINLWKSLFSGNLLNYYDYNVNSANIGEMFHRNTYGFVIMFVVAIWQLPLYIIEIASGQNVLNNPFARFYGKFYLLIAIWLCAKLIYKISLEISNCEKKSNNSRLLFLSSVIVMSSVCITGQIDILGVCISLCAILSLIRNNNRMFYFLFCLSINFKVFPIFIFIPIIILLEKNIIKIIIKIVIPIFVFYLIELPFNINSHYSVNDDNTTNMLDMMFENKIHLMGMNIPIVMLVYTGICLYAYLSNVNKNKNHQILYLGFIGIASVLLCYNPHPYRWIYLIPFMSIFVACYESDQRILLVESICMNLFQIGICFKYYWIYDFNNVHGMFVDYVIPLRKFALHGTEYYWNMIEKSKYYDFFNITFVAQIAIVFVFLIRYCPFCVNKQKNIEENAVFLEKKVLIFRAICAYLVSNIILVMYGAQIVIHIINII